MKGRSWDDDSRTTGRTMIWGFCVMTSLLLSLLIGDPRWPARQGLGLLAAGASLFFMVTPFFALGTAKRRNLVGIWIGLFCGACGLVAFTSTLPGLNYSAFTASRVMVNGVGRSVGVPEFLVGGLGLILCSFPVVASLFLLRGSSFAERVVAILGAALLFVPFFWDEEHFLFVAILGFGLLIALPTLARKGMIQKRPAE